MLGQLRDTCVGALWVYGCVGDSAVIHPGPSRDHRYFKLEVVSALEKRLLRDMQADKGENGKIQIQTESHEQDGNSRSSKKGER